MAGIIANRSRLGSGPRLPLGTIRVYVGRQPNKYLYGLADNTRGLHRRCSGRLAVADQPSTLVLTPREVPNLYPPPPLREHGVERDAIQLGPRVDRTIKQRNKPGHFEYWARSMGVQVGDEHHNIGSASIRQSARSTSRRGRWGDTPLDYLVSVFVAKRMSDWKASAR